MKKVILIFFGILLLIGACVAISDGESSSKDTNDQTASGETTVASDTLNPSQSQKAAKSPWTYKETIDEMTDKKSFTASVESENSVDFDFPYHGGSTLKFTLRDDPQFGHDVYIRISNGQFNTSFDGTKIKLRIDDNPATTINCSNASDGSMDILFLNGYDKIVKSLKGAKTMKISAEFFSEGTQTFTFNVEDLVWNH